jgi:hypothetical protein
MEVIWPPKGNSRPRLVDVDEGAGSLRVTIGIPQTPSARMTMFGGGLDYVRAADLAAPLPNDFVPGESACLADVDE